MLIAQKMGNQEIKLEFKGVVGGVEIGFSSAALFSFLFWPVSISTENWLRLTRQIRLLLLPLQQQQLLSFSGGWGIRGKTKLVKNSKQ